MNEDSKRIFSDNLVYYMAKNRISRNKLCQDLNFKYPTVSDWISAKKYPRIDKIEMLANYFGIKKSDLIEKSFENQAVNNINNENTTITGTQANIINNSQPEIDEYAKEILNLLQNLTISQKAKIILMVNEISEENKK